jgi:predicted dehydrogenase
MSAEPVSRRELLSTGLIAGPAAALAFLGSSRVRANEHPLAIKRHAPGTSYKIGILGCGNRSKAHLAALNAVPQIEVAALCDVVPHKMEERAKLIRKGPAPRRYVDMEKMVRQEDLDAIAVVLPNHLHKLGALTALRAGKHVFCEKPMALTVADCNEMIAAAARARKALQIGTQRRHSPGQKAAVTAIRQAALGNILSSDINSYRGDWRAPAWSMKWAPISSTSTTGSSTASL